MASGDTTGLQQNRGEIVANVVKKQLLDGLRDSLQTVETIKNSADDVDIGDIVLADSVNDITNPNVSATSSATDQITDTLRSAERTALTIYNEPQTNNSTNEDVTEAASTSSDGSSTAAEPPTTVSTAPQVKPERHIMISYNRASCSDICREICNRLRQENYKVWFDQDQLHGSVTQAMAEGVENAYIVLFCMNRQYYKSAYCEMEAKQTVKKRIKFIPCIMEKDFSPEGWLDILIGDQLYVDFSLPGQFDQAFNKLLIEIKHIENGLEMQSTRVNNDTVIQARFEAIVRDFMTSINKIDADLETLTREEAILLVKRLQRELITDPRPSNMDHTPQQQYQLIQNLLVQSRNQRELLDQAVRLLAHLNDAAAIVRVLLIILVSWTVYKLLQGRYL